MAQKDKKIRKREKKKKALKWPSHIMELNLIKMLWHDLKHTIYAQPHQEVTANGFVFMNNLQLTA